MYAIIATQRKPCPWYDTIKPVIDKHAAIQHKIIKTTKSCPGLTQEFIRETTKRDQLKRNRWFDEYKKQRNYILNLVEKAVLVFKVNRKMTSSYKISLFRENNNRPDIYITKALNRPLQDQSIFLRFFLLEFAAISHQNRWKHQHFKKGITSVPHDRVFNICLAVVDPPSFLGCLSIVSGLA